MFVKKMVTGSEPPQTVRYGIKLGMKQYTIAFDVKETEDGQYQWSEVTLSPGIPSYGVLVSAIVRGRYTDDEMQAIVNNHLLDDGNEEHEAEWDEMQAWRAEAKKVAKEILEGLVGS